MNNSVIRKDHFGKSPQEVDHGIQRLEFGDADNFLPNSLHLSRTDERVILLSLKDMYHDDEDLHMCINCHTTIVGLENYISHRNAGPCKSQHPVKGNGAPIPVLPPLDLPKAERMRTVPSTTNTSNGEHLNFLNADFFFSSLELQSRRKDAVFEEVMGIEEVLEEEYEERGDGGQGTVYVGGGKWGYEDYVQERDVWPGEVERGKDGVGMDREGEERHADVEAEGNMGRVEDIDMEARTEVHKEIDKKIDQKNKENVCETEESNTNFVENVDAGDNYSIRESPTKQNGVLRASVVDNAPPMDTGDICELSGAAKGSRMNEFDITLDNCNIVIDSLNSKEDDQRYRRTTTVPPSGHTRGKWIPGLASEGMRKSGNAVEYYCKPCNKNIRNRRSYEAHLSTSCHLKKLMINTQGGGCTSTSEGPRLRSRRAQLSKKNSLCDSLIDNSSPPTENESEPTSSHSDSQNYLMESLGIKRKVAKSADNVENTDNSKFRRMNSEMELKDQLSSNRDGQSNNFSTNKSDVGKQSKLKIKNKVLKKTCKTSTTKSTAYPNEGDSNENSHPDATNMNFTASESSFSDIINAKKSDKPSLNNLNVQKESLTNIGPREVVSLDNKTENIITDITDDKLIKSPLVNLGYRCDSVKFKIEQQILSENARSKVEAFDSTQLSSDKNLQDEMMLGLELIRTDHHLTSDVKLKKHKIKTVLKLYDDKREETEKTKYFDGNNSGFHSVETVDADIICKKVANAGVSVLEKEALDKDVVDQCLDTETTSCNAQNDEIVFDDDRMQHALAVSDSETCSEDKKFSDKECNSTVSKGIVEDLAESAVRTESGSASELSNTNETVNDETESHKLNINAFKSAPNNSVKLSGDEVLPLQVPCKRPRYSSVKMVGNGGNLIDICQELSYGQIKDLVANACRKNEIGENGILFQVPSVNLNKNKNTIALNKNIGKLNDNASNLTKTKPCFVGSGPKVILIKKVNKKDLLSPEGKLSLKKNQILICKSISSAKTNQNQVKQNAEIISNNLKNKGDQTLTSTSSKISSEFQYDPLNQNSQRKLFSRKPVVATPSNLVEPTFDNHSDNIEVNNIKKLGTEHNPDVMTIIDDECESLDDKTGQKTINHENVEEIICKGAQGGNESQCMERVTHATSKNIACKLFNLMNKLDNDHIDKVNMEKGLNNTKDKSHPDDVSRKCKTNYSILPALSKHNNEVFNKLGELGQKSSPQTINIVINVDTTYQAHSIHAQDDSTAKVLDCKTKTSILDSKNDSAAPSRLQSEVFDFKTKTSILNSKNGNRVPSHLQSEVCDCKTKTSILDSKIGNAVPSHLQSEKNPMASACKTTVVEANLFDQVSLSNEVSHSLFTTESGISQQKCVTQNSMKLDKEIGFLNKSNSIKHIKADKLEVKINPSENVNVITNQNKPQRETAMDFSADSESPKYVVFTKVSNETGKILDKNCRIIKKTICVKPTSNKQCSVDQSSGEVESDHPTEKVTYTKMTNGNDSSIAVEPDKEKDVDPETVWYLCGLCGYKSDRHWCVERHMGQHLPRMRGFPCKVCNQSFLSLDNLRQHMARHDVKKWSCGFKNCHRVFSTKNELIVHQSGPHETKKMYKCPMCDYSGKHIQALRRHKKIHEESDDLVNCTTCTKDVRRKYLERHKKKHENEEPYFCPFCDFKSRYLSSVQRHILQPAHNGKKLYNCPFCSSEDGKDEELEHSSSKEPPFSTNVVYQMACHINSEHSEEKDFNYIHHGISKIVRKLHIRLQIRRPNVSSLSDQGSSNKAMHLNEKNDESLCKKDVIVIDEVKKKMLSNVDTHTIDSNHNVDKSSFLNSGNLKTRTSSGLPCVKHKNIDKEDQSSSFAISTPLDAESGSSLASTCNDDEEFCMTKCGGPFLKTDVHSKNFDVIFDVTNLMKKKAVPKSGSEFMILNPDSPSKSSSSIIKIHNLNDKTCSISTAVKKYNKEPCVPVKKVISQNAAGGASSDEKGAKICCISNVFTMAESSPNDMLSAKNVNDKNRMIGNITSLDNNTMDLERNFWPREDTVSNDDANIDENEVEVEDIKLEKDGDSSGSCREEPQNLQDFIPQQLILPGNSSEKRLSSNPVGITSSSPSHRKEGVSSSEKTRDSEDTTKPQTSFLSKQRRKKPPRWTSEVEVIKKSDGVISLWPVSL